MNRCNYMEYSEDHKVVTDMQHADANIILGLGLVVYTPFELMSVSALLHAGSTRCIDFTRANTPSCVVMEMLPSVILEAP